MDHPSDKKRLRTLTGTGKDRYDTNISNFHKDLSTITQKIDHHIEALTSEKEKEFINIDHLQTIKNVLIKEFQGYEQLSKRFSDYLDRTRSKESENEASAHQLEITGIKGKIDSLLIEVDKLLPSGSKHQQANPEEVRSQTKSTSNKSYVSGSSHSSWLLKHKAKSEIAKKRLQYAELEAKIEQEKARIEEEESVAASKLTRRKKELAIDMNLLSAKREAEEAQTEFQVVHDGITEYSDSVSDLESEKHKRTEEFVRSHWLPNPENRTNLPQQPNQESTTQLNANAEPFIIPPLMTPLEPDEPELRPHTQLPNLEPPTHQFSAENQSPQDQLDTSPTRQHATVTQTPVIDLTQSTGLSVASEFTKLFLKKELLLSRLTSFTDEPENYLIWKSSFSSIMLGLDVTPPEEIDLLVRWLGSESSKQAKRIQAANTLDPKRGLKLIWDRLDQRYGSPEQIESILKKKVKNFSKISSQDFGRLYELSDILSEIESIKTQPRYSALLAYYDSASGVNPIVSLLPYFLQGKWTDRAFKIKTDRQILFPPFADFVKFIREMSTRLNDPSFAYENTQSHQKSPGHNSGKPQGQSSHSNNTTRPVNNFRTPISTKKTDINPDKQKTETSQTPKDEHLKCVIHDDANHTLNQCRVFRTKALSERKEIIMRQGICFRCCDGKHLAKNCDKTRQCIVCKSNTHSSALHIENNTPPTPKDGGEPKAQAAQNYGGESGTQVHSACTQICGDGFSGKSCAKTILVRAYPTNNPQDSQKMYAIIDDQSNRSLAKSKFFELFNVNGPELEYSLSSCSGNEVVSGRRAHGFTVEGINGTSKLDLPTLIECNQIPDVRAEIPTPSVALHHGHLQDLSGFIPPLDNKAEILLLIGRDLLEAHHVHDQRIGPRHTPYAQKLLLGWVIIGEACLGNVHVPDNVNVNKTFVLPNGRTSLCEPCTQTLHVNEKVDHIVNTNFDSNFRSNVFLRTADDEKVGKSVEDKDFLEIMDSGFVKMESGNWSAPLPFRKNRSKLSNNFEQAYQRAKNLESCLKRNPKKLEHFSDFMTKIFEKGHAEKAPPLAPGEECWYLPIFGVYHPKKRDKIRVVFDSSAKFNGISLNDVLLTGPDLTNSLIGVLLRFRREEIAVTADIEQMFFNFYVHDQHRNYLRFLWHKGNDPNNELCEYRMKVHVFGNSPSPAVATFGLRKSVCHRENHETCDEICDFVNNDFYVDDGLVSLPEEDLAVKLMKNTQEALKNGGNLRLHKISSNNVNVLSMFPVSELAPNLTAIDFESNSPNLQRSLGLIWNVQSDTFTYSVSCEEKPFTRRGMLSTVNSIFDPLGFLAPVILGGKIILRNSLIKSTDWDQPLSSDLLEDWDNWKSSLASLSDLQIPRAYCDISPTYSDRRELHIFSDASKEAIGAVAYLKIYAPDGHNQIGFIMGKSKLAPAHGHTIPRLELCAALLAVEISTFIHEQLGLSVDLTKFYTDSKVVLGYINNITRRFYVYVSNRVDKIRRSTSPDQWSYVPTNLNPADQATRPLQADQIQTSLWLKGPPSLLFDTPTPESSPEQYDLIEPGNDTDIRPEVSSCKTTIRQCLGTQRFERFSTWSGLIRAISFLKRHLDQRHTIRSSVEYIADSEKLIVKEVQLELYSREIKCLSNNEQLPKDSSLLSLSPFLDSDQILRVGGRLTHSDIPYDAKKPVIISGKHHISTLIVRYYHEKTRHQGRHITEGAVRSAGYWITGGKGLISSLIHKCVKCRKLRSQTEHQKMSDLPKDRLTPSPPFTFVGVDTFGPWSVVTRKTRGGQANSKRWAILFSCLVSRGIHIEVVEELSSSSFINSLKRFTSLRGPVKEFRSDRGTNFVGATDDLGIDVINIEDKPVQNLLDENRTVWKFNAPHSSHMSGAWERMIGITRRILDSLLSNTLATKLTHEVLCTFMAEVCAIINARPLVAVSSDPDSPTVLSPASLITQKTTSPTDSLQQFDIKDIYKSQWKHVQVLADRFWKQWQDQYLQTLQSRRIWTEERENLKSGDLVLFKDNDLPRNQWPMGVIIDTFPSTDGRVRKVSVRINKDGNFSTYTRPVTELVYLLS